MLTVEDNGLTLSTGLLSRIIATTGQKVKYSNGNESSIVIRRILTVRVYVV